jgi:hypothetical protein
MILASRLAFEVPPAASRPAPPLPIVFEPAERARWEYHVVALDPREDAPLDQAGVASLGEEGWLLAAVLDLSGQPHGRIHYYFVRAAR